MPHNLVLAKAVPQQGHWTTFFRLHHRCKSFQKVLSPLLSFANYLWRPKATPNLESFLQQWQVQSTSNKGARKPTTQVNQFVHWKIVSDCVYALSEDIATLLFSELRLDFGFLLEIFPLWPTRHCNRGIHFNSLYIIPFPLFHIQQSTWKSNIF